MKNITTSFTGFASSLLLNAGFDTLAQKLDPVASRPHGIGQDAHGPSYCMPSAFTPKPRSNVR